MEKGRQAVVPLTAVSRVETVLTVGTDTTAGVLEAEALGAPVADAEAGLEALVTVVVAVSAGAPFDTSEVLTMVPVAVPALVAAVDEEPASDPLAPQADKTTQQATRGAARPKISDIERPGPKEVIGMGRIRPETNGGHNVLKLRLRVCIYAADPTQHNVESSEFRRADWRANYRNTTSESRRAST
jgi:hypothetical protein